MCRITAFCIILASVGGALPAGAEAQLDAGQAAPQFELIDQHGKAHRLEDYAGRWLVLYFYPKDDTPGCTTEACSFRDDIYRIRALGAEVAGVSLDSAESHARFAEKHGLPFALLSDASGDIARRYGVLAEAGNFARRATFLIDPAGRVAKVYREVDPAAHSGEVIADLHRLTGG
jgi:peroxiredoxin Q/BCP